MPGAWVALSEPRRPGSVKELIQGMHPLITTLQFGCRSTFRIIEDKV